MLGTSIILYHFKVGNKRLDVVIESLGEKEYNLITTRGYKYNSPKYGIIEPENVYYVGELNFDNPEIINLADNLKIFPENGYKIYSSFDFENAELKTENGVLKLYDTYNPIKILKYKYCQIGKPKYIIIFKGFAKY